MKITEKQHRAELAEKGYAAEDIDLIAKAKCDKGEYEPESEGAEGDEGMDDEAMEKALKAYEADLKKAENVKKLAAWNDLDTDWKATNPETRPPDERKEIPEDIDGPFTGPELLEDIIKALSGAVKDAVAEQGSELVKAVAPLAKALAEQTAIMKAQGALIKAQAETLGKIAKAARRADAKAEKALGSTPAKEQPKAPQGYRAAPEPGQKAPASGPSISGVLSADDLREHISKALGEMNATPRANWQAEDHQRFHTLNNAMFDTYGASDLQAIAKAVNFHPQA